MTKICPKCGTPMKETVEKGLVHENLQLAPDTKVLRLPPKYFYEHHKHEHEIWERAARNVFMCGGGNNVGDLNPGWKPLRQICAGLGLENWTQTRKYLRKGNVDPRFNQWLVEHRFEGQDFEHEMMEFFKWYKWLHPKELEGIEPVENVKEASSEEVQEYVQRVYRETLGKDISEQDKMGLAEAILSGQVESKNLPNIFRNYQKQVAQPKAQVPIQKGEKVRLAVPVDVDVHITEDIFQKALVKSDTFWRRIKPRMDLGKWVEEQVWDKTAFHLWFYKNHNQLTVEDLRRYVEKHGINTVALCIMGYHEVLPMILENIRNIGNIVDEIHVQGDNFTEDDISKLGTRGAHVHIEPWKEEFSDYKNKVIAHANTQWVLICDHDEIPTEDLVKNLRKIIDDSEKGVKYNIVQFNCIDVTVDKDGKVIQEEEMGPRKQLLHVNIKDPYYGNPHIWLKPDYYSWKSITVPYAYKHIKEEGIELVRAVRNVFLGGGGDNWREKNDLWVELRAITDKLKIFTWKDFHAYLKKGNIDPGLKELFERMYKKPWHDEELRAYKQYYYKLHPEESD